MLNLEVDILMDPLGVMDRMKRLCREKDISLGGCRNVTPVPPLTYLNLTQTETDLTRTVLPVCYNGESQKQITPNCPTLHITPELEHFPKQCDSLTSSDTLPSSQKCLRSPRSSL